jgi:hypothetical protein
MMYNTTLKKLIRMYFVTDQNVSSLNKEKALYAINNTNKPSW